MYLGEPEQMCAPVATQKTRMTVDGINPVDGAVGRQNGAYFIKYMDAAIAVGPRFLFIHAWNEWTAQNLGTQNEPWFVDLWKTEYNADIEPMEGGHGWKYYEIMVEKIGQYKDTTYTGPGFTRRPSPEGDPLFNYPNPFRDETNIQYNIKYAGWIRLSILDIFGKKIVDLVNEHCIPGSLTVKWNGRDNSGNPVPSGVYYCQIKTGVVTETRILIHM